MSSPPAAAPAASAEPITLRHRLGGVPPLARAGVAAVGVAALLLLLTWTAWTDHSYLVPSDFFSDAWYIGHQAEALRTSHSPSLFLHSSSGVFYPIFAFYGGTLFAVGGALALIVAPTTAEIIIYAIAFAAAYGGWLWLARLAGVRSWMAHAPAALYVTAPYVVTNLYVRQDLTETVATAAIPLLLASAWSVMGSERLRAGPAAALAGSTVAIGGSHNLTLLWAATLLVLLGIVVALAVPQARGLVTRRGTLRILAVVVPAMAVNAWYLLPDLAYQADTVISHRTDEWRKSLTGSSPLVAAHSLFGLSRRSDAGDGFQPSTTLPVLAMAWVAVAAFTARRRWREPGGRLLLILAGATTALIVVMTHSGVLGGLPDPWIMLQFSYRLETYVLFGVCGAMIAALALVGTARRWLVAALVPILALSIAGAFHQSRAALVPTGTPDPDLSSFQVFSMGDFSDGGLPAVRLSKAHNAVYMGLTDEDITDGRVDTTVDLQPGNVVYANILGSPDLLQIHGARVIGRWPGPGPSSSWQRRWSLALRVDDDAEPGNVRIVIAEARSLPIRAGRVISLLGLAGLLAVAGTIAGGAWRRRRAGV
jgi:hypothetical protein